MSTLTPLLSLVKPDSSDIVNVANFNTNADILDASVLLTTSQTLTNKTLTSPTISAPTISGGASVAGGLSLAGGLTVSTTGIDNQPAISTSSVGASITGLDNRPSFSVGGGATGVIQRALYVRPSFTHSTDGLLYNIHVAANSTGASSSGVKYGISIGAQTGANFTNYGLAIAAPSGATNNWGLHNDGTTFLTGAITMSGGAIVSGGPGSGTTQYGVHTNFTATSTATSIVASYVASPASAAAVHTVTTMAGLIAATPTKGAGSTITSAYGVLIEAQSSADVNNYGLYIVAPLNGSGENLGIRNNGGAMLTGASTSLGFFGTTPIAKVTVTGSRAGNAALASLLTQLASYGILTDNSS